MTPWETTPMKTLLYYTLLDSSRYAGKLVRLPKHEDYISMSELVDFYMYHGQKHFEKKYQESPIVESEWFLDFVKRDHIVEKLAAFLLDQKKAPGSRQEFLEGVLRGLREYSVLDTRGVMLPEEKQIEKYLNVMTDVIKMILRCARGAVSPEEVRQPVQSKKASRQRYLSMLESRESYLEMMDEFLRLGGREDWTRTDLCEYPAAVLAEHGEFQFMIEDYLHMQGRRTMKEWLVVLNGASWESESVYMLRNRYRGCDMERVPESVKVCMKKYYNNRIAGAEFRIRTLTDRQDGPNRQGMQVDMLLYFAESLGLDIPEEQWSNLLWLCPYPPKEGGTWLPEHFLGAQAVREAVIYNVRHGIANDVVLGWHIRYCIDHGVVECRENLMKVARNHPRRMWLREIAMEYICRYTDPEVVKREILPRLQGELFFYTAQRIIRPGDEELADIIWDYGVRYAANKMHADVLLVFIQSRRGIDSFLWHTEKRHQLPPESREYGIVEAVRSLSRPEVFDQMERIFALCLRDRFRDDPNYSLRTAIADAFVQLAWSQPEAREKVRNMFVKYQEKCGEVSWKQEYLRNCMKRAGFE